MTAVLLRAERLGRVAASGKPLLRDIELTVPAGGRLSISGPSGGGKSLLLRALALLDSIDAGRVLWRGRPVEADDIPGYRAQVHYLHQRPALIEGTVEENLRLPFSLRTHRDRRFDRRRAAALLTTAGRDDAFLRRRRDLLSGGEEQLTALVRALQLAPSVLLLDEPTAALDPATTAAVEALVNEWYEADTASRAFVWVTHDAAQAERVAAERLEMAAGRLVP